MHPGFTVDFAIPDEVEEMIREKREEPAEWND